MRHMRHITIAVLVCIVVATCAAQGYLPVGKQSPNATSPAHTFFTFTLTPDSQVCNPTDIPTPTTLKTKKFDTHTVIKTGSELAKLNVSWLGGISGNFNANQLYAVSDSGRFSPCLAKDGKTTVFYGQVIRTVIQMNDYKVDANASIAIVAASATVSGKSNTVDLYEIGYGDSELDKKLVAAKGIVSGSGVNIDNYSDFSKAVIAAEQFAVAVTNPGIDVVGYDIPAPSSDISLSLAMAWAVREMADGRGCEDAIKRFRQQGSAPADVINSVYSSIAGGCAVDDVGKAKARQLLNGLKIGY